MTIKYPGTGQHRKLLKAITSYYQDDPRILALGLFGSLARGNWDKYSDLDLDAITQDGIELDVMDEV
ncbi:nucleotidyltransferase domain-containing protein [Chloroflexi bacterium TSY]|nr:nucleotidyltransferase domain-containing protein [Chloroflexi bacterium TSY]